MKKMLLVLLTLGVIFSCGAKEEAKPEEKPTTETTTEPVKEGDTATEAAASDIKFKDAEVQKFVDDYGVALKDYAAAIEAKDDVKIKEASDKVQEIMTKAGDFTAKLTDPEEAKKFGEVMTKLSEEFTNEATKMAK